MRTPRTASSRRERGRIAPRLRRLAVWTGAGLVALLLAAVAAQPIQKTTPGMPIKQEMPPPPSNDPPDANAQMRMREQQAAKQNFDAANAERKRQIAADSAKLLKLATELKTEVDKTTKDTLSLGVIRKAEEIERLAHGVKEKMKLTVGAN
ncbi:MAG: hypothetical protein WCE75_15830 [Terracidiphilus sp.]